MTTSEKVAYLKGLAEGLAVDPESKEGKLFTAIIDVLADIASDLEDIEENALDLAEEIDAISEDLSDVEEIVYDEDEDDYDDEDDDEDFGSYCCGGCGAPEDDEDPTFYEVTCPACENTITVDEDVLELGKIQCPNCGEMLEFDFDAIEDDEDDEDPDAE